MGADSKISNGQVIVFDQSRTRLRKGTIVMAIVDTSEFERGELGVVLDTERESSDQGTTYWVFFEQRFVSVIRKEDLLVRTRIVYGAGVNDLGDYSCDSLEQALDDLKSGLLRSVYDASTTRVG